MFDTLSTIFSTLNSLRFGSIPASYFLGFMVAVPILAYLLKKK